MCVGGGVRVCAHYAVESNWSSPLPPHDTVTDERGTCPGFTRSCEHSSKSQQTPSGSLLENEGDVASTLNILNVLDELLSAGTDRRIHYLISKGGSEALLSVLVNTGLSFCPNYTVLLPLLHLLAKVGHRDSRIGLKAEETGAVLLTLNLLKHNAKHVKMAAACLWVIQVFSSSVSAANLIGENHGLDVIFQLIPQYTTKNLHTIKAAINAFAALLCSKDNVCSVISKGYISGLLQLYEDWHSKDTLHTAIEIQHMLLRCFHKVTHNNPGRQAFISQGGLRLLYHTTQTDLLTKGLESLVEPSVQLMRKCLPKTPLPLTSDQSAYTFLLPGRAHAVPDVNIAPDNSSEDSDDDDSDTQQAESKDYDDDLETDVNRLCLCPDLDRPKELLPQYGHLCPELSHDFKELNLSSEPEESSPSSDEETLLLNTFSRSSTRMDRKKGDSNNELSTSSSGSQSETETSTKENITAAAQLETPDFLCHSSILGCRTTGRELRGDATQGLKEKEQVEDKEGGEEFPHCAMIDKLLKRHGACIPHHEPQLYRAVATQTKSIPGFSILPFPDFWGHVPPARHEPMVPREPNIQRYYMLYPLSTFGIVYFGLIKVSGLYFVQNAKEVNYHDTTLNSM